jgi:hypothetical protein
MARLLKLLLLLALVCVVLGAASYAGARATAGKLVGRDPPMSERIITFAYQGVPELPGRPRAWVITYGRTRLPGVRSAIIYVSPVGRLLATMPRDLDARLDAYEKALEP